MCGRYTLFSIPELTEEYRLALPDDAEPRYNIAPSQQVLAISAPDDDQFSQFRWGLIPFWADDESDSIINARAETVDKKPTFKKLFKTRRCLIPADGFFEWKKDGERKQPYHLTLKDRDVFCFAGLWDTWSSPADDVIVESCTIITTSPNDLVREIHNRMPVIMPREHEEIWLDAHAEHEALKEILKPYDASLMNAHPVSTRVNSPRNDSPDILEEPDDSQ